MTESNDRDVVRGPQPEVQSKPNIALISGLVIVVLCALVFIKNSHQVSLDFIVFEKTTTLRWAILMSIVLGILLDRALTIWWHRRRRRKHEDG